MPENVYEGMLILDSNQYGRNPEEITGQVNKLIEDAGGEVLVSRLWMDGRRLAYPIAGHRKGTYWLSYFRLDSQRLAGLNRQVQLNGSILRHLFLKIDPRLVDMLVEHAKSGPAPIEEEDSRRPRRRPTGEGRPREEIASPAESQEEKETQTASSGDDATGSDQ